MEVEKIMQELERKHPGESEFLQAVKEVLVSLKDVYNQRRYWPVQRRIAFPSLCKPFYLEVLGLRANVQKRTYNVAYGRR